MDSNNSHYIHTKNLGQGNSFQSVRRFVVEVSSSSSLSLFVIVTLNVLFLTLRDYLFTYTMEQE